MKCLFRIAMLWLALAGSLAQAQVEVFTDRAAWQAAAGAFHEERFDDRSFEGLAIVEVGAGHGWGVRDGLYDDRVVGSSSYTVFSFESAITAFGADWNLTPGELGQGLRLVAGSVPIGPELPGTLRGGFFGFTSAVAFDTLVVVAGSGPGAAESYRMDNLAHAAPVPEPQTYVLMILGLIAIGVVVAGRMK